MYQKQIVAIMLCTGAFLAITSISNQFAYAQNYDEVLEIMITADSKLSELKNSEIKLNKYSIGKVGLELKQIGQIILEINEKKQPYDEKMNKIYDYLKGEYIKTIESFESKLEQYKNTGLTMQEKRLIDKISIQKNNFHVIEKNINQKKHLEEKINKGITETKAKQEYQKLVNKIGIQLAEKANGNKIQKIHHKLAIKEITKSKNWELAIPAIDRIIKQTNNEDHKIKLIEIKENVSKIIEKKNNQRYSKQVYTLKQSEPIKTINLPSFTEHTIENSYILNQILEEELVETINEASEIIINFEQSLESEIGENSLQPSDSLLDAEISEALNDVSTISDEDDKMIKEKRDEQRKNAKDNNGKSNKKGNDKANNGNGNNGNGKGKGNLGEGKGKGKGNK